MVNIMTYVITIDCFLFRANRNHILRNGSGSRCNEETDHSLRHI